MVFNNSFFFILEELDINLDMRVEEIKNKLINVSMEYWEKQGKENTVTCIRRRQLRTYYTFKPIFKKEMYL